MTKFFKKTVSLLAAAAMSLSVLTAPVSAADSDGTAQVGALMDYYKSGSGTFTVSNASRIFVVSSTEPTGDLLQTAQLIQRQFKAEFEYSTTELVWGDASWAKTGDIVLVLDASSGTGADGYKLNVNDTTAIVTAIDTDGLIYGSNTLLKMFRAVDGNSLSGFTAADTPDTKERTVMLDIGRKYYTVEWICNFIKQISWMGYNALELHFSEDGGFRADLWDSAYYKDGFRPVNDFTWLCGSYVQTWVYNGNKNNASYNYKTDPNKDDYLTTAELVKICEAAKEYHIEIIPSFDSPAHMDYICWKFEQNYLNNTNYSFKYNGTTYNAKDTGGCINYTGKTAATLGTNINNGPTNWPCYTTIDISENMAKAFVFALYEDMANFFKVYAGSNKFSIGADEVNMTSYTQSYPRTWSTSQFPAYVNELNTLLRNKGYTVRMFNDFMGSSNYSLDDFASTIEVMYWDSPFSPNDGDKGSGKAAAKFVENNRTLYNCIQTHTYYVLRIANASGAETKYTDARNPANRQWTFYHSTEDLIYNEWKPNNVSEIGDRFESTADIPDANLGGAYFLIWNDYASVSTESEVWNGAPDTTGTNNGVTYYLFDRMASNITKMWNADVNNSVYYDDFAAVRNDVKAYFPGYTSCSAAASLPGATAPVPAADFSALTALFEAGMISNDDYTYTEASYADYVTQYQAAVTNAEKLLNDNSITKAEVEEAIADLKAAENVLVALNTTEAYDLLNNKVNSSLYTADSYAVYETAYNNLAEKSSWKSQDALDALVAAVNAAKEKLEEIEVENNTEHIHTVKSASAAVKAGKKVVLIIETKPEIKTLSVAGVEQLALSISSVQTIGGKEVKVWMLKFVEDTKGEHRYIITGTTDDQTYTYTTAEIKVY